MTATNFATGQIPTGITVDNATTSQYTKDISYPAGETLSAGNVVFIENAPTTAQATSAQNIGDVTANTRISFPAFGSGTAASTLKLNLAKVGSPSPSLSVRIETDNAGSPSGTLVDANAAGTVTAASLLDEIFYGTATDAHGVGGWTTTSDFRDGGVRITTRSRLTGIIVTKESLATPTKCTIASNTGTILETVSFVGDTATFTIELADATIYRIYAHKDGASYTHRYTSTTTFPLVGGTNFEYTNGWYETTTSTRIYNIVSITTTGINDTTVTLSGSLTIPVGQKCHVVTYQGTYGSETVNASNYYKIGYYTNNSTTRGQKLWNGSVHSAMDAGKVPYTSSTLFTPRVLSKTDADYSYKIDWHGISQEAVTAGQLTTGKFPVIAIEGVDSNQTGMTQGTTMYLGNTAGSISSSAGTNSKKIGKSITTTKLQIYPIPL